MLIGDFADPVSLSSEDTRPSHKDLDELLSQMPLVRRYRLTAAEFTDGMVSEGFLDIAGPCAIESEDMLNGLAQRLRGSGIRVLRGGSFKHRTLPYSFSGLGENGLRIHKRVAEKFEMLTISEFMDADHIQSFRKYVDIVQIGSRNMRNYFLFKHAANLKKPVLLKRDMTATLREWLGACEHLLSLGVEKLALCERGVRWHDPMFRNLIDLNSIAWVKQHLSIPIIADPSHACGRSDLVTALSLAATAIGSDGLMIEVHSAPTTARCDAEQAVTLEEFAILQRKVHHLRQRTGGLVNFASA
jgi:3-deoxy-7-phosphoheptulonate synthase